MKKQIRRLSPHQNGKVVGILSAVMALLFVIPIYLGSLTLPSVDAQGNPTDFSRTFLLYFPIGYLIFGYIGGALASLVYNQIVKLVGGIEYEAREID